MTAVCLHSRDEIEPILRQDTFLHLYELGDLDDFFWQYTTWYGLKDQGQVRQVCLVYTGTDLPVLLGLSAEPTTGLEELLRAIKKILPGRIYAHLSGKAVTALQDGYQAESHGVHDKMALTRPSHLAAVGTSAAVPLTPDDLPQLQALYDASYPGNWFDPRMLETGCYFGIRAGDYPGSSILSVAGVHVYSPRYRVTVLGNITTHPQYRGRGLGKAVTARLCQALLPHVDHIGLNVRTDNQAAIAVYRSLGFETVGAYEEFMLEDEFHQRYRQLTGN